MPEPSVTVNWAIYDGTRKILLRTLRHQVHCEEVRFDGVLERNAESFRNVLSYFKPKTSKSTAEFKQNEGAKMKKPSLDFLDKVSSQIDLNESATLKLVKTIKRRRTEAKREFPYNQETIEDIQKEYYNQRLCHLDCILHIVEQKEKVQFIENHFLHNPEFESNLLSQLAKSFSAVCPPIEKSATTTGQIFETEAQRVAWSYQTLEEQLKLSEIAFYFYYHCHILSAEKFVVLSKLFKEVEYGHKQVNWKYSNQLRWKKLVQRIAIVQTFIFMDGLPLREIYKEEEARMAEFKNRQSEIAEHIPDVDINNDCSVVFLVWNTFLNTFEDNNIEIKGDVKPFIKYLTEQHSIDVFAQRLAPKNVSKPFLYLMIMNFNVSSYQDALIDLACGIFKNEPDLCRDFWQHDSKNSKIQEAFFSSKLSIRFDDEVVRYGDDMRGFLSLMTSLTADEFCRNEVMNLLDTTTIDYCNTYQRETQTLTFWHVVKDYIDRVKTNPKTFQTHDNVDSGSMYDNEPKQEVYGGGKLATQLLGLIGNLVKLSTSSEAHKELWFELLEPIFSVLETCIKACTTNTSLHIEHCNLLGCQKCVPCLLIASVTCISSFARPFPHLVWEFMKDIGFLPHSTSNQGLHERHSGTSIRDFLLYFEKNCGRYPATTAFLELMSILLEEYALLKPDAMLAIALKSNTAEDDTIPNDLEKLEFTKGTYIIVHETNKDLCYGTLFDPSALQDPQFQNTCLEYAGYFAMDKIRLLSSVKGGQKDMLASLSYIVNDIYSNVDSWKYASIAERYKIECSLLEMFYQVVTRSTAKEKNNDNSTSSLRRFLVQSFLTDPRASSLHNTILNSIAYASYNMGQLYDHGKGADAHALEKIINLSLGLLNLFFAIYEDISNNSIPPLATAILMRTGGFGKQKHFIEPVALLIDCESDRFPLLSTRAATLTSYICLYAGRWQARGPTMAMYFTNNNNQLRDMLLRHLQSKSSSYELKAAIVELLDVVIFSQPSLASLFFGVVEDPEKKKEEERFSLGDKSFLKALIGILDGEKDKCILIEKVLLFFVNLIESARQQNAMMALRNMPEFWDAITKLLEISKTDKIKIETDYLNQNKDRDVYLRQIQEKDLHYTGLFYEKVSYVNALHLLTLEIYTNGFYTEGEGSVKQLMPAFVKTLKTALPKAIVWIANQFQLESASAESDSERKIIFNNLKRLMLKPLNINEFQVPERRQAWGPNYYYDLELLEKKLIPQKLNTKSKFYYEGSPITLFKDRVRENNLHSSLYDVKSRMMTQWSALMMICCHLDLLSFDATPPPDKVPCAVSTLEQLFETTFVAMDGEYDAEKNSFFASILSNLNFTLINHWLSSQKGAQTSTEIFVLLDLIASKISFDIVKGEPIIKGKIANVIDCDMEQSTVQYDILMSILLLLQKIDTQSKLHETQINNLWLIYSATCHLFTKKIAQRENQNQGMETIEVCVRVIDAIINTLATCSDLSLNDVLIQQEELNKETHGIACNRNLLFVPLMSIMQNGISRQSDYPLVSAIFCLFATVSRCKTGAQMLYSFNLGKHLFNSTNRSTGNSFASQNDQTQTMFFPYGQDRQRNKWHIMWCRIIDLISFTLEQVDDFVPDALSFISLHFEKLIEGLRAPESWSDNSIPLTIGLLDETESIANLIHKLGEIGLLTVEDTNKSKAWTSVMGSSAKGILGETSLRTLQQYVYILDSDDRLARAFKPLARDEVSATAKKPVLISGAGSLTSAEKIEKEHPYLRIEQKILSILHRCTSIIYCFTPPAILNTFVYDPSLHETCLQPNLSRSPKDPSSFYSFTAYLTRHRMLLARLENCKKDDDLTVSTIAVLTGCENTLKADKIRSHILGILNKALFIILCQERLYHISDCDSRQSQSLHHDLQSVLVEFAKNMQKTFKDDIVTLSPSAQGRTPRRVSKVSSLAFQQHKKPDSAMDINEKLLLILLKFSSVIQE